MRAVLGVIGHVDHGKTALVRALTGMETDRLEEEKRRGISIALGFAHLTVAGTTIDLVDMPGHERFVRTMVAGATGVDAVLLVVAANEGIKPQTAEHVDIAGLLGVGRAVLAITKADLVSPAQAEAVAAEAATLLRAAGIEPTASIATSVPEGQGLEALRDALLAVAAAQAAQPGDGFAYLPIDRVFTLPGQGTIVTGTLRRGPLALTDLVSLAGQPVRLRALQVHGTRTSQAMPGQRVAANLRDVPPGAIARGAALTTDPGLVPSPWLTVALRAVPRAPPLPTLARLALLFGTEEVEVRLRLLDCDTLEPGQRAFAQLKPVTPVAVPARERFILRRPSPPLTLAGGHVIDPAASRLRRHAPASLARLASLADATPAAIVVAEVEAAGAAGATLARLGRLAGLSEARAAEALQPHPVLIGRDRIAVSRPVFDALLAAIPPKLAARDLPQDHLARLMPGVGRLVLDMAVAELVRRNAILRTPAGLRLHAPGRDRERADSEAAEAARIAELVRAGGLSPPDPTRVLPGPQTKRLVDRLVKEGLLVRALDKVQKREILFHADAIDAAKRALAPLLQTQGGILVGEAGAALGISRKFCVPLLEHLDATRFTTRINDRRVLTPGPGRRPG